eukprot:9428316-Ditylum_brightwellii.AAC.1
MAHKMFAKFNFKIKEDYRYLEGYIGPKQLVQEYVEEKIDDWVKSVETFSAMMAHQPQAAFAGYARFLQFEWTYIQHTIEVKECVFDPLEEDISSKLLTKLFEAKHMPPNL